MKMESDMHTRIVGQNEAIVQIAKAVRRAREVVGHVQKVEVEVATLAQVREALKAGADILLLDNMKPEMIRQAVELVREKEPEERHTLTAAAGGITLENVRDYAEAGADLISISLLTQSAPAVEISFKIKLA